MSAKIAWPEILKIGIFCWRGCFRRLSYIFRALPGAARCARASPYGRDMTCRDGSACPSKNTLPGRGVEAKKMLTWFSGILITFSFSALHPDNSFQYPPVSLFVDMSTLIWFRPGVPKKFLEKKFASPRLRSPVQKIAWPRNLTPSKILLGHALSEDFCTVRLTVRR